MLDARQSLLNKGLRALTPLPAFEDVLDQRVAAALRRLGFPDAVELARMREQITDLQQRLEALGPAPKGRLAQEFMALVATHFAAHRAATPGKVRA